jgi:hypothetical protein
MRVRHGGAGRSAGRRIPPCRAKKRPVPPRRAAYRTPTVEYAGIRIICAGTWRARSARTSAPCSPKALGSTAPARRARRRRPLPCESQPRASPTRSLLARFRRERPGPTDLHAWCESCEEFFRREGEMTKPSAHSTTCRWSATVATPHSEGTRSRTCARIWRKPCTQGDQHYPALGNSRLDAVP